MRKWFLKEKCQEGITKNRTESDLANKQCVCELMSSCNMVVDVTKCECDYISAASRAWLIRRAVARWRVVFATTIGRYMSPAARIVRMHQPLDLLNVWYNSIRLLIGLLLSAVFYAASPVLPPSECRSPVIALYRQSVADHFVIKQQHWLIWLMTNPALAAKSNKPLLLLFIGQRKWCGTVCRHRLMYVDVDVSILV